MTVHRLLGCSLISWSLLLAASVPTLAQAPATEFFYVANASNGQIFKVDFENNTTTQINTDASQLGNLGSLLVRNDGGGRVSIVVCDAGAGRVRLYENVTGGGFNGKSKVITSAIPMPDGISQDESGNLFLITSGPGSGGSKKRQLWTIPRDVADSQDGYGDAVLIDGNIAADLLEDTRVVRTTFGSLAPRDVIVLWRKPARITRYRPDGAGGYMTPTTFASSFPPGTEPAGMAFGGGYLLVSTIGGNVLRVRPDGTTDPTNFVSGLGNGPFKIAVGFQDDEDVACLVQRNGHSAFLIKINADGTGTVDDSESQNLESPQGVGIGNGNGVFIPAVPSVTAAFQAQDTTFTGTTEGGGADLACRLLPLPDPRESECNPGGTCSGICQDGFCERDLLLNELDPGLPYGGSVTIPGHVRALRIGDPVTGTPHFYLCEGQTSASFRFASTLVHEDEFLNWEDQDPGPGVRREPDCQDPVTSNRAMFYWTPIPVSEPQIFEGTPTSSRFINLSTGCVQNSSNRGDIDDYSILLPAAREMDPFCKVADDGLAGLLGALGMLAEFIPGTPTSGVEKQLLDKQAAAVEAFRRYKRGNRRSQGVAMQRLDEFITIVGGAAIDNTARNVSGELIVRARSARYVISQVTLPVPSECEP